MILQRLQRNTEMYDSVKVFALSAVIVTYCSVHSYPVYTENYDPNENNNSKIIQQTPGEEGDFFEGDIIPVSYTHLDVYKRQS